MPTGTQGSTGLPKGTVLCVLLGDTAHLPSAALHTWVPLPRTPISLRLPGRLQLTLPSSSDVLALGGLSSDTVRTLDRLPTATPHWSLIVYFCLLTGLLAPRRQCHNISSTLSTEPDTIDTQ